MDFLTSLLGILVFIGIAWLLSEHKKNIRWKTVLYGLLTQFVFALFILKTGPGKYVFASMKDGVNTLMKFTAAGSEFVFGDLMKTGFSFALLVLPTIIFFSSLFAVLYYFRVLQLFVRIFTVLLSKILGTSGAESLSAAANIFMGQTEAPLMVKPYVEKMTRSELMTLMTGGMATVSGGVLAAYVGMGVDAGHLIAASVMSAPAAIIFAKIIVPETETPLTVNVTNIEIEITDQNPLDAAARGAHEGMFLALNVAAMLIAFIAFVAMFNYFLALAGTSMEQILGFIMRPFAFLMGVPWEEAGKVGTLLGEKTVLNEFVAYKHLGELSASNTPLSSKSTVIATYALCGFANFASIAIQLGGISGIAPSRRGEIASLGLKAMIAGTFASFITANIAALLL
ncbi:MAG: NupC/NupG family nucleoside CNT transporter [Deltaproteobacteria bacterium]|nr:NupC/NupG family nucleoside CNT transporter [Deltaproteobacteria bacterium]